MATRMTAPERRQAPRISERVSIAITGDGQVWQAQTKDLSTSGAYCLLDQFIPPMTKLQLQFELPDGAKRTRIEGTGVVVRAEPVVTSDSHGQYSIAIYFSDMSERHRAAISKFVSHRLSSSHKPSPRSDSCSVWSRCAS